ncbi:hypothetical protein [Syntrophobacter fumaroxidans]|uniref:Uncharacterized protein n=1 Tax=Syntrophobacter fumaroxidans (strain DSM 10017 / MPOB) TaxID=335543 RepID=A0LEL2_SYNFM|nr:hypothetical protein [Syntrophobacter fumaroxidans]ABK15864.1 hypothetical protein Sfum_0162 [Syntrophobacter fumaroxidans MPOB]HOI93339.1 hypothetical protein [Syntrophobacter fumaroxidans]
MKKKMHLLFIIPLLFGLLCTPVWAETLAPEPVSQRAQMLYESPPAELILADVFILRPAGIVATALGLAGSIVAYPFGVTSCSTEIIDQKLVREPWDYTFCRPVGRIDY